MTELGTSTTVRGAAFWYFYRRLGKWQWRGLLTSLFATLGGLFGQFYQFFFADPLTDKSVSWNATISWQALVAGLGFLVAFALFFFLRSFFKWAALVVALIVAGGAALSYSTGINLDTSRVQNGYSGVSNWLWQQGKAVTGMFFQNIPGGAGAAAGAFLGFRRPKS